MNETSRTFFRAAAVAAREVGIAAALTGLAGYVPTDAMKAAHDLPVAASVVATYVKARVATVVEGLRHR